MAGKTVRVGGFAPLTSPGLVAAGRHLRAGLELGVADVNEASAHHGCRIELLLADSAGDPERAAVTLDRFAADGMVAVVGEYHSMVARELADRARSVGVPFICSSATLDALTSEATDLVARLAPPQSRGWSVYGEYLLAARREHVALVVQPGEYWTSGARVLEARLRQGKAGCSRIDAGGRPAVSVIAELAELNARSPVDAVLLLVGYPEPVNTIVKAVRSDDRFARVLIGDPAGRAEFADWAALLGQDGIGVPYLRYLPPHLSPRGARVARRLTARIGEEPSFVAFEGYDTILILAEALRVAGNSRERLTRALPAVSTEGTRGPLSFSQTDQLPALQWVWPPVEVAVT